MRLKVLVQQFLLVLKRNSIVWFFFKLAIILSVGYCLYFLGRLNYDHKLDIGLNCFCKTDSVFIDRTNYLDQIGFKFTIHTGKQIRYLSPIDADLETFNYSRVYTVRYLCDDYNYNELILEDWDELMYKKDNQGRSVVR